MLEVVFCPIPVLVAITWWDTTDFGMLIFFDIYLNFSVGSNSFPVDLYGSSSGQ